MTETTPDEGTTATYSVPEYKPEVPKGNKGSGRWAVYDTTLERYVGEVSDTKPSAEDARTLTYDGHARVIEV